MDDENELYPVPNWPVEETKKSFGQLSGISVDVYGNPVLFHRGDRTWDSNTFDWSNKFSGDQNSPLVQKTILTLNASNGGIINAWGDNFFFMPHMLTVDHQNNVWVTDVAMHQVFKFGPYGGRDKKPMIEIGERFVPGSDNKHYCKPTSVAVMEDGQSFFVADGYCNSRIIKYKLVIDETGYHRVTLEQLLHWGDANGAGFSYSKSPYALNIPHSLALAEQHKLICVADRENGRVQCFDTDNGKFVKSYKNKEFGDTIYGVDYTSAHGKLFYHMLMKIIFSNFRWSIGGCRRSCTIW